MKKLGRPARIPAAVQTTVDAIPLGQKASFWDKPQPPYKADIERFKAAVMEDGLIIQQNRCGWCGLLVGSAGRRSAERDHIAPKGKYPAWTYEPKNLVLACEYCNGSSVKGRKDTVETARSPYDLTTFNVVHPYLDNVPQHIEIFGGIIIKGISKEGRWTVSEFKLDSPEMTSLRAKDQRMGVLAEGVRVRAYRLREALINRFLKVDTAVEA